MTEFNARQVRWMSGVAGVTGLIVASFLTGQGPLPVDFAIIAAVLVVAACALWTRWKPVRWLVAAGVAFVSAYTVYDLARMLPDALPLESLQEGLLVADAIATTALTAWLGARGVWILLDRARGPSRATPRLVGGLLVIVAAAHLSLIEVWTPDGPTGTQLSMGSEGVVVLGFTGWQIWHGLLAATGLGLALAPARWAAYVATLLVVLVLYVVPASLGGPLMIWQEPVMLALPLYMAMWLRVELGLLRRGGAAGVTGGGRAS
jgi:hypothetical protein